MEKLDITVNTFLKQFNNNQFIFEKYLKKLTNKAIRLVVKELYTRRCTRIEFHVRFN
jgi:hypothetical protein